MQQQQQNQQVMFWVLHRLATTTESNIDFALWNFKGISPLENIQTRPKTTRVATTLQSVLLWHLRSQRYASIPDALRSQRYASVPDARNGMQRCLE